MWREAGLGPNLPFQAIQMVASSEQPGSHGEHAQVKVNGQEGQVTTLSLFSKESPQQRNTSDTNQSETHPFQLFQRSREKVFREPWVGTLDILGVLH